MLVLSRKVGEKLVIGDNVVVVVNRVSGNRVTLGIEAPDDVRIIRGELEQLVTEFETPVASDRFVGSISGDTLCCEETVG